jgi:hypothetical protein
MISKIKALALASVAVAAIAGAGASAAQAGELAIGVQPAILTAHSEAGQQNVFVLDAGGGNFFSGICATGAFEGTTTGQAINEWTVTPTFGTGKGNPAEVQGCTFGGVKAQVLMNACKYTFKGAGHAANTFTVDIVGCTNGKQIEIKTALCTVDIPMQNGLSHVIGKQLNEQEVTLDVLLGKITTTQTGAGCPNGNNFQAANTAFASSTIMTAYKDNMTAQVTKHQHQYTEHLCGTQVSLMSK